MEKSVNNIFIDLRPEPVFQMEIDMAQHPQGSITHQVIKAEHTISEEAMNSSQIIITSVEGNETSGNTGLIEDGTTLATLNDKDSTPEEDTPQKMAKPRIRCKECVRYSAETEEQMLRHVRRVHRGVNPFQCTMCEYSTYNSAVFQEHVDVHRGVKPHKCRYCPYSSASKKNAKNHELVHRPDNPNRCAECGFIARHVRSLANHQKREHQMVTNEPEFCCRHCNRSYPNQEGLAKHTKTCRYCGKQLCSTEYKKHLSEHKAYRPSRKRRESFNCKLCRWSGSQVARILLHLIHHPGQDVDESDINVSVLRECGIQVGAKVVQ